jgi:serine/threonine protein kinase
VDSQTLDFTPYRGKVADSFASHEVLAALSDPHRLLDGPEAEILLDGRNRVGALKLPVGLSRTMDIVVKKYRSLGINKLKSLFQASKAARAWRGAISILDVGLKTPHPVAYLERRKSGFIQESYFISERILDAREIRYLFRELDEESLRPLLAALARTIFSGHEKGILHRDLSDGNILVRVVGDRPGAMRPPASETGADVYVGKDKRIESVNYIFYLLDTNRIRLRKRIGTLTRAKNLIRLGVPRGLRIFFLEQYAGAAERPLSSAFIFWYKLNKSIFTGWIRFKKFLRLKKLTRILRIQ